MREMKSTKLERSISGFCSTYPTISAFVPAVRLVRDRGRLAHRNSFRDWLVKEMKVSLSLPKLLGILGDRDCKILRFEFSVVY